jgi:hypothetical protein
MPRRLAVSRASAFAALLFAILIVPTHAPVHAEDRNETRFFVTFDRGEDLGQSFGTLFEVDSADGSLTFGAGFQNLYNTYVRGDRHAVQFFVRPAKGSRPVRAETLPRPNALCGTYLESRDEVVRSVSGPPKSWDSAKMEWRDDPSPLDAMRVADGLLDWTGGSVRYKGVTILPAPESGVYTRFYYANGHLCFYHVDRRDRGYRPWTSDADGFSKLWACPWKPGQDRVDLASAVALTLPVVGETTFAWGQLGSKIVTGSNIGGFYVFDAGRWSMLLRPNLEKSYQLYSSMAYGDRLLMGQYPTGRLFAYDGQSITDLEGWPPVPKGVSGSSREAQTTAIYGGELFLGVWPWGELWSLHPKREEWRFERRMFDHPAPSADVIHPYDVENVNHPIKNQWGQRVTSLVTSGPALFVSTSAKDPCPWDPVQNPFLAPEKWKSYGAVHRLEMPGHLGAAIEWTDGPLTLEFRAGPDALTILREGKTLARAPVSGELSQQLATLKKLGSPTWGRGLYGPFAGRSVTGRVER